MIASTWTWSPTDHGAQVGTTATTATRNSTLGGGWLMARSDLSQSSGQHYVEFTIVQLGNGVGKTGVGLASGMAAVNTYPGADNNGIQYQPGGNVIKNGAFTGAAPPTYTTGDVLGMIVDLDAHTVKFNKNGGTFSATSDITSLGSDVFVACGLGDGAVFSSVAINSPGALLYSLAASGSSGFNLIAHGDSMTLASGAQKIYVPRTAALLGSSTRWTRVGINGASWGFAWSGSGYASTLTQDALLRVDTLKTTSPLPGAPRDILIVFAGTNGIILAFNSAATEYAAFKTYIAARLAAGWRAKDIVVCTMLPRTGLSEVTRSAYNASLVGDDAGTGYKVCRFDQTSIGAAGDDLNTLKYSDGTHPTDAGHAVLATALAASILTM